jgi:hypothetical protein
MKFEPVTLESLRSDKAFAKATKKHQKDLDSMRKRQQKEKATIQKNQVSAVERIVKGKKYNRPQKGSPRNFCFHHQNSFRFDLQ